MRDKKRVSIRRYFCPEQHCDYSSEFRFRLKNHLIEKHGYRKKEAAEAACDNEYHLNPTYIRASYYDDYVDDD